MALSPNTLASMLQSQWLPGDDGPYPQSAVESADKFAGAVASWFASATAGAFPCATAAGRRPQLAASAAGALQAQQASAAGSQLGLAVAGYFAGQVFGAGVASFPAAVAAGQSALIAAFTNLDAPRGARANQMATGIHAMAISTMVVFPPVISPPAPIL